MKIFKSMLTYIKYLYTFIFGVPSNPRVHEIRTRMQSASMRVVNQANKNTKQIQNNRSHVYYKVGRTLGSIP